MLINGKYYTKHINNDLKCSYVKVSKKKQYISYKAKIQNELTQNKKLLLPYKKNIYLHAVFFILFITYSDPL